VVSDWRSGACRQTRKLRKDALTERNAADAVLKWPRLAIVVRWAIDASVEARR